MSARASQNIFKPIPLPTRVWLKKRKEQKKKKEKGMVGV